MAANDEEPSYDHGSYDTYDSGGYDAYDTGYDTYDDGGYDDSGVTNFVSGMLQTMQQINNGRAGSSGGSSNNCTPGRTAHEKMINQSLGCPETGGGNGDQWGDAYKGYQGASGGYSRPSGGNGSYGTPTGSTGQGEFGRGTTGGPPEPTGCIMEGGTTRYIGCPIGDGRWQGGPKGGSGRIYNSYQEMLKNERRVP